MEFHSKFIQGRFALPHYTFDVYVAATADAVKLVDFNPIGGATSPLLFSWEELPFSDVLQHAEGRPCAQHAAEEDFRQARVAGDAGVVLPKSEDGSQQAQQAQHVGATQQQDVGVMGCCDSTECQGGVPSALPPPPPFEFRIISEPVALRPNKVAYGVPYDFVDASEGSALSQLMEQLGGTSPDDLWAALRSQAG